MVVVVVWGTHCLLENFALGLTRASSGRLERRSSVAEAVTTFLHATVSAQRNYNDIVIPCEFTSSGICMSV